MRKFTVTSPTGLNGRRGPSKTAEVVRVAKHGTTITAQEVTDGYAVTKAGVHYDLTHLREVK